MDTLRTDTLHIVGGRPLRGRVRVGGAKNAALPLLAAAALPEGETTFRRVPNLTDVRRLGETLTGLGARVRRDENCVRVNPARLDPHAEPDARLTAAMRGSVCLIGPLLARHGRVSLAGVGGCDLGPRPLDRHLAAFAAMGARVTEARGRVSVRSDHLPGGRLRGAAVNLSALIPDGERGVRVPTVTGTANVLCAAATADGVTVVRGAAREPEVVAVGRYLNACGARVTGLGTDVIHIVGVDRLAAPPAGHPACLVPADRVEAATWLCAAAATRGRLTIDGVGVDRLRSVADALRTMGVKVRSCGTDRSPRVCVSAAGELTGSELRAGAYPAVPTDALPQLAAVARNGGGHQPADRRCVSEPAGPPPPAGPVRRVRGAGGHHGDRHRRRPPDRGAGGCPGPPRRRRPADRRSRRRRPQRTARGRRARPGVRTPRPEAAGVGGGGLAGGPRRRPAAAGRPVAAPGSAPVAGVDAGRDTRGVAPESRRPFDRRGSAVPAPLRRLTAAALAAGLLAAVPALADYEEKGDAAAGAKTVEVSAGDLTLTVPETWTKEKPASRMRLAQFAVPAPEGVTDATELAIFGGFGGTDAANLRRWVDQFAADGRKVTLTQGESREGSYKLLDASGTWNAPVGPPMMSKTEPKPGSRMLAAIVAVEGKGNYFLKMAGPAKTVGPQIEAFRASFGATKDGETEYELE